VCSSDLHGSVETTVGEMESRWYDSAHTMTEAEKMVEDYNNGTLLGPHSLACVDVGQADASIKM
jgi:hypothetical protein